MNSMSITRKKGKTIGVIGRQLDYSRTRVLVAGLRATGWHIICLPFQGTDARWVFRQVSLIRQMWILRNDVDLFLLPALNSVDIVGFRFGAWLARKPLAIDMMISLHDTLVYDRKIVLKGSIKAHAAWVLDWACVRFVDLIIYDTAAHRHFFEEEFGAPQRKGIVSYVGVEERFLEETGEKSLQRGDNTNVLWYGGFSPLHGVDVIIEAAHLLQQNAKGSKVRFRLIGEGQTKYECLVRSREISNITFEPSVPYEELPRKIIECDIGLGIFGSSAKASRVIPNKVFQMAAMGKPVITMDSAAIWEVFSPGHDIITVKSNAEELAKVISRLATDFNLRKEVGTNAKRTVLTRGTPRKVVNELSARLCSLI